MMTETGVEEFCKTITDITSGDVRFISERRVREAIDHVQSCGSFTNRHWSLVLKQRLGL